MNRIGLIGHIADGKEMYDGQTVSTRLWRDELSKVNGNKVYVVDTYKYKKRVISVLFKWLKCMFTCNHIVIMLSANGLNVFLPMIYYFNKVLKKRIYHRVIGGSLGKYVQSNPKALKYMNSFEVNWVQSPSLVKQLEELGMVNAQFLENFRDIEPIKEDEIRREYKEPYEFCTFCRVSKAKGITLAADAVAEVNRCKGKIVAKLHVYGPIEDEYAEEFNDVLHQYKDFVEYKGSVPSYKAVSVLKNYYMHLFPTTWEGEGFPGTLIDCYNAALPTIASDWAYNAEFVEEGVTGYLYNWKKPEQLVDAIRKAIDNRDTYAMRLHCLQEAEIYCSQKVMRKVLSKMELI